MSQTYKLSTLRDVFERVPADKIALCMSEIARGMVQARALFALASDAKPEWPDVCEWIDDGLGQIDTTIVGEDDGEAFTLRTTRGAP